MSQLCLTVVFDLICLRPHVYLLCRKIDDTPISVTALFVDGRNAKRYKTGDRYGSGAAAAVHTDFTFVTVSVIAAVFWFLF